MRYGILGLVWIVLCAPAFAERPSTGNSMLYIVGMSQIGFDASGTVLIPVTVMEDSFSGEIDQVSLLVLGQHIVNDCVENVLRKTPARRTSYVAARTIFEEGLCEVGKCYQSATLLTQLTLLGEMSKLDENAQAQLVAQLSKTYGTSCSGGAKVDPALLTQAKK